MTSTTEARLQAYLASAERYQAPGISRQFRKLLPRITCADGTVLSVQVGDSHYCAPRDNDGPWRRVEVGFPSKRLDGLMEWAEDPDKPTETVYGYVPIGVVAEAIDQCGGFSGGGK